MDSEIQSNGGAQDDGAVRSMKCSAAERIAMKALLHQWLNKGVKTFTMPGAWEYDKEAAELVETTAELLGIERPWTRR